MNDATEPPALRVSAVRLIDELCDEFEAAWARGERPQLESYLARVSGSERLELLRELLGVEIHYRRRLGEAVAEGEFSARLSVWFEAADLDNAIAHSFKSQPLPGQQPQGGSTVWLSDVTPPKSSRYGIVTLQARGGMGEIWLA